MNLIVMLTYNDVTVANASEVFKECKDLPVEHWGFKNVGLEKPKMKELVKQIKQEGKTTYLEVVTYTEPECLEAAKLAVECEFDYLMGTIYFESVAEVLKQSNTKYMPFCGKVWASPSILGDTVEDIVESAKTLEEKGVDGIDILAYRFKGDVEALLKHYFETIKVKTVVAGSVDTFERISYVKSQKSWGFTMGSALFNKKFVSDGTVRDNLKVVCDYLEELNKN